MRIRAADTGDLAPIVDVFRQCWSQTYGEQLSRGLQQAMDTARARELWEVGLADPAATVLVAEADQTVLGVVRFRMSSADEGYLASLYVAPRAHGRGVGRALLSTAEDGLVRGGARSAWLWVFADNAGAQQFYRRSGWQLTGQSRTEAEFGELEIGMTKTLADSVVEPP